MMTELDHDDGLVHGHAWATDMPAPRPAARPMTAAAPLDGHDDGLVHSHAWACGERGAPVHGRVVG